MNRVPTKILRFGLIAAAFALPSAYGSVLTYTNLAAWQGASWGLTTVDFEGIAPPDSTVNESPSVTISGVTFGSNIGAGSNLFIISGTFGGGSYNIGSGDVINAIFASPNVLTITLPANITAIAFDYGIGSGSGAPDAPLAVALSTGDNFNLTLMSSGQFLGITSTSAITSLTLSTSATYYGIDNFSFGQSGPVPEPSSWILMSGGILALGWKKIRKASSR